MKCLIESVGVVAIVLCVLTAIVHFAATLSMYLENDAFIEAGVTFILCMYLFAFGMCKLRK